ncbi:hypothetical protein Y032_0130g1565 [Ancylostoma ceylanicum]|uniref:Uncharacterized protein n=1 Tax=Ancylostoma ceylanicum TaxID=53326 RepID=A0A016T7B3_9BILA|nr:hypothetical protein Y032_0130g1565 [Ancylostoma ceylanicum]
MLLQYESVLTKELEVKQLKVRTLLNYMSDMHTLRSVKGGNEYPAVLRVRPATKPCERCELLTSTAPDRSIALTGASSR